MASQLIWFLFWAAVTVTAAVLRPNPLGHGTHTELGLPPCPSVLFFGRPCPGCGLTTSFSAFVHGRFGESFHAHPFGPFLYMSFTMFALACLCGWLTKQKLDFSIRKMNVALVAFAAAFLAFGAIRFATSPHYGDSDPYHRALAASAVTR